MRYLSDMPTTEELDSHSLTALLNHCKAQLPEGECDEIEEQAAVIFDATARFDAATRRAAARNGLRGWARYGATQGPRGSKQMAGRLLDCLTLRLPVPPEVRAWIARCERECRGNPKGWAREWGLAVSELDGELGL